MKKLLVLLSIILPIAFYSCSNKPLKEGKMITTIIFPNTTGVKYALIKNMMNDSFVTYFKNGNVRTEMISKTTDLITIYNKLKDEAYLLSNNQFLGKYAMITPGNELKSVNEGVLPEVKLTDDKKVILGYNCKRAILTYRGLIDSANTPKTYVYDCWYTNEIEANNPEPGFYNLNVINGVPMEITIREFHMAITFKVKSVEKTTVPDSLFSLPANYPVKTKEEIMNMYPHPQQHSASASDTAKPIYK